MTVIALGFAIAMAGLTFWLIRGIITAESAKVERMMTAMQDGITKLVDRADERGDRLLEAMDKRADATRAAYDIEMKLLREALRDNNRVIGRNNGVLERVTGLVPVGNGHGG